MVTIATNQMYASPSPTKNGGDRNKGEEAKNNHDGDGSSYCQSLAVVNNEISEDTRETSGKLRNLTNNTNDGTIGNGVDIIHEDEDINVE